jgi:UTP--glucose-1-phosphate uridylyltransferase
MIPNVRTAVFPAAGLGTRFLPATKAVPKAMLTVIDRPMIQYAVEEALEAGIERFIFVTAPGNRAIEDHFSPADGLAATLGERGRTKALADLDRDLPKTGTTYFVRQPTPLGLGHAIWCARDLIAHEPFAVLNPDVIMRGRPGCLAEMLETYGRMGGNVVSVAECRPDQTHQYGIVDAGERVSDAAFRIKAMVEKPAAGSARSNLKIFGRYILQQEILMHLSQLKPGVGQEIQLTDALVRLADEQPIFGHLFRGRSFDCGSREGFVAANVALALEDDRLAAIVRHEVDLSFREPNGLAPGPT